MMDQLYSVGKYVWNTWGNAAPSSVSNPIRSNTMTTSVVKTERKNSLGIESLNVS